MTMHGYVGLCIGRYGAMYGNVGQCWAMYGYGGLCMAI